MLELNFKEFIERYKLQLEANKIKVISIGENRV